MDALKRAEEAKKQAAAGAQPAAPVASPASPPELSLDPLDAPAAVPGRSLPPLSRHLDSVDADLAASVGGPLPRRGSAAAAGDRGTDDAARTAVKNAFAVKQEPRPRTSLWLFVGLGGAAALAIAGYFWWQLQGLGGGSRVAPPPAVAAVQPPVVPPTASPPPAVAPSPAAIAPSPAAPPVLPAGSSLSPQAVPGPAAPPAAAPRERRQRDDRAGGLAADDAGVVRASSRRPQAERTLDRAYEDWQAGRLDEARSAYEQALRADPRNADALLGLAAIALRQGQLERAQNLYLRVLESDPADATAQAALINLHGGGDGGQSESRLKTLLAAQPDSPPLHFALGNLYSRQRRWSDAQQAYFQAYALDPDNPDYLFNVAVSLDHLRQGKLALQYYRMALNAADLSRAAFDRNAARQRILELQP
ncbi:MAG: cellulose synthase subunit BcsC [Candidatus Accumulibacter adjunctus]|uniref:Cellulose synthase subunit BcsC n=1 Tax=Candidatus Accumulibacter adjunctus TaxID=1454001 RepID=A0A011M6H4_9PROT|nr:MAG: cellulose synthase subunit BcsC [Candidatus Accumulibacter adjunctus]